jgi:hypothetical protein
VAAPDDGRHVRYDMQGVPTWAKVQRHGWAHEHTKQLEDTNCLGLWMAPQASLFSSSAFTW